MIKPPLINEDEWQALRGLVSAEPEPSAAIRQAWHWYNTRIQILTLIVFGFAAVLISFADRLPVTLNLPFAQHAMYSNYFMLRGGLLIAIGLVGLWSWCADWRMLQVQGALLLLGVITFAIDWILVYNNVQGEHGLGYHMMVPARVLGNACLALNLWRADALPPRGERKLLWWRLGSGSP